MALLAGIPVNGSFTLRCNITYATGRVVSSAFTLPYALAVGQVASSDNSSTTIGPQPAAITPGEVKLTLNEASGGVTTTLMAVLVVLATNAPASGTTPSPPSLPLRCRPRRRCSWPPQTRPLRTRT
jgi:hypothetical protein